ncbi:MAG: aldehyde dehydrogenase family protein [Gammaproteobacteria bacterium]|nr:aldehyde dehydrogenase family protein [Gammaproteobacteria bacterium]
MIANIDKNNKEKVTVTAPFDNTEIATLDAANSTDVEKALSTAHDLFNNKPKWLSATQRINILNKTAELMREQFDKLVILAASEGGKPLSDSQIEVERAIDGILNCIQCIRTDHGTEIPMGINPSSEKHMAFTRSEPIGVVVAISAFNHPLNLIIHQVGPAIATGCPVIIKPAEDTPLSCYNFVSILREAGLPHEWCQALVVSDLDVATQLVSDSRVGFFSFIGSANVGWMLRSKLAPGARCALEHGGVAPVIIEADADLIETLPAIAKGGFYHAGQVCVSVQRVYCHRSVVKVVASNLAKMASKLIVGDPTNAETEVGPLIRPIEVQRISKWVNDAIKEGAELLVGGKVDGNCYQPTVLLNPSERSTVSTKEIFGPVICIYTYDNLDDAIKKANALPFAFQASIFTKNIDNALHAYKQLNASAVMVNDHTAFRVDWMPFAGLRHSGLGVGGIPHTYHDMQIKKMMVLKSQKI